MAMYTKQTQMEMDALEASLISYGLVPRMRLTYNAAIVALFTLSCAASMAALAAAISSSVVMVMSLFPEYVK